jgi:urease accessory protein UreH
MDGDIGALLARRATFDGAKAYGSLIYAGAGAATHLTRVREIAGSASLRLGATSFRNLLIVRLIGRDPLELRDTFANIWRDLRTAAAGLPAVMPRLWSI